MDIRDIWMNIGGCVTIFIIIINIRISLIVCILINIINSKINQQLLISLTQIHKQKYGTNYYKAVKWAGLYYALLVLPLLLWFLCFRVVSVWVWQCESFGVSCHAC